MPILLRGAAALLLAAFAVVSVPEARADGYAVQIMYLDKLGLTLANPYPQGCRAYSDHTMNAGSTGGKYDKASFAEAKARVEASIRKGMAAGCYVKKTKEQLVPWGVTYSVQTGKSRLLGKSGCAHYGAEADRIALSSRPRADKDRAIAKLFVEAAEVGCSR